MRVEVAEPSGEVRGHSQTLRRSAGAKMQVGSSQGRPPTRTTCQNKAALLLGKTKKVKLKIWKRSQIPAQEKACVWVLLSLSTLWTQPRLNDAFLFFFFFLQTNRRNAANEKEGTQPDALLFLNIPDGKFFAYFTNKQR